MSDMLTNMLKNMDEDTARDMLGNLDEEQVQEVVEWAINETIIPHLEEIKQRESQGGPSTAEVRDYYESMSEEEREEEFYDTLDNLVATLVLCRERPQEGFKELKAYLRDPYTVEALLLIFENEEHIDPEYTQQLKDFGVEHMRWVGAMVMPEMYSEEEVERALQDMGMDPNDAPDDATPGGD